ncbi:MAG TPA: hypothetical protein PKI03_34325 [Pseudomonadota bacterium]|nr:hypothetical protein [Pseudomonadota bacterium]
MREMNPLGHRFDPGVHEAQALTDDPTTWQGGVSMPPGLSCRAVLA